MYRSTCCMTWPQHFIGSTKDTHAITYPITRRGIPIRHKKPLVAESEVLFYLPTSCFCPVCHSFYQYQCHHRTAWNLRDITWHYFKMLAAHAGKSYILTLCKHRHRRARRHNKDVMHHYAPISLPHNTRSSSSLSLSPCRQMLVPLKLYSRQ